VTLADFTVFVMADLVTRFDSAFLKNHPKISENVERVRNIDNIKKYLAERD